MKKKEKKYKEKKRKKEKRLKKLTPEKYLLYVFVNV